MQNPPTPPSKSNSSRPGFLDIDTPVETVGVAPHWMMPPSRTGNKNIPGPFGSGLPMYYQNLNFIKTTTKTLDQEYQTKSSQLAQSIEDDLTAARLEGPTDPLFPLQSIVREMGVLNTLTQRKTAEFHTKTAIANSFFRGDPFNRHINDFMQSATRLERYPGPNGIAMQAWNTSYRAAHDARLLSQTLQSLNQRSVNLQQTLSVLQAAEQAELAVEQEAAERARLAAQSEAEEQARIATLRQALAEAQSKAHAAEQHFESEQARLQAEMEQQIDQIQKQLEAESQTLEIRWKVINTATALAHQQARLASLKIQQLKAKQAQELQRQQADLEAQWLAETLARWQSPTFANIGSSAVFGPAFAGTAGTVNVGPAAALALRTSLRAAISAILGVISTTAAPILVGFAALLTPSRLGNGDLYSVSVPLSELTSVSDTDLYEIAARKGEINLPVSLGSKTTGSRVEIVVATTDGVNVPSSVPVNVARFDAQKNVYVSAGTAPNGPVITWTPVVDPQNPSTHFPVTGSDVPIYKGATVTPVEGRIDTFPLLDSYDFGGFITVFPVESGIPPLYVVFNSPYEGATTTGKYSGRKFNPEQAGGPILDLDWRKAVITQEGIEAVKLHISRLDQSDANDVMVQRLEKILHGYWVLTNADLRYYTHEMRELERFRALGLSDDFKPENGSPVWNNAHTATLEDYKLSSDDTLLYSPDAITAGNKQIKRIYEQMLKGKYE